jgi:hypothetical protein
MDLETTVNKPQTQTRKGFAFMEAPVAPLFTLA